MIAPAMPSTSTEGMVILFPEMLDAMLDRLVKADTCHADFHAIPERSADLRLLAVVRYLTNIQAGFGHEDALMKAKFDTLYR